MAPERARDEVANLAAGGMAVELIELAGQWYAHANSGPVPSPLWSKASFDILIAIPAAYDAADLDAFYIELPYRFSEGEHPRIQGQVIETLGRQWRLVSWHYPDNRPWMRGVDNLETHLVHCRGFFLHRGAVNGK
jgi:hypothetical protein